MNKAPWQAKQLSNHGDAHDHVILWADKGGQHMRRVDDREGRFTAEQAHLIAAAPELLAALEEVFVIGDRLVSDVYGYEFVGKARSAIAKAKVSKP